MLINVFWRNITYKQSIKNQNIKDYYKFYHVPIFSIFASILDNFAIVYLYDLHKYFSSCANNISRKIMYMAFC